MFPLSPYNRTKREIIRLWTAESSVSPCLSSMSSTLHQARVRASHLLPHDERKTKTTMKLSNNFHIREFDCRDGSRVPPELTPVLQNLVTGILQPVRDYFQSPLYIISGYRTCSWNAKVGGAENSVHLTAGAADFRVAGAAVHTVHDWILDEHFEGRMKALGGLGIYPNWIHADVRKIGVLRRWAGNGVGSEPSS